MNFLYTFIAPLTGTLSLTTEIIPIALTAWLKQISNRSAISVGISKEIVEAIGVLPSTWTIAEDSIELQIGVTTYSLYAGFDTTIDMVYIVPANPGLWKPQGLAFKAKNTVTSLVEMPPKAFSHITMPSIVRTFASAIVTIPPNDLYSNTEGYLRGKVSEAFNRLSVPGVAQAKVVLTHEVLVVPFNDMTADVRLTSWAVVMNDVTEELGTFVGMPSTAPTHPF